jgi:hypothetical protein
MKANHIGPHAVEIVAEPGTVALNAMQEFARLGYMFSSDGSGALSDTEARYALVDLRALIANRDELRDIAWDRVGHSVATNLHKRALEAWEQWADTSMYFPTKDILDRGMEIGRESLANKTSRRARWGADGRRIFRDGRLFSNGAFSEAEALAVVDALNKLETEATK